MTIIYELNVNYNTYKILEVQEVSETNYIEGKNSGALTYSHEISKILEIGKGTWTEYFKSNDW